MTKEELLALAEEQRNEILSWLQEAQAEQQAKLNTQGAEDESQKTDQSKDLEESVKTEVETKTQDEQTNKNGGEQEVETKTDEKTDENTNKNDKNQYDATQDIKNFGNDLKSLMEAQSKTLEKLEEYAKSNSELKAELDEIKKRNPMGNYISKPSDDDISKADKERDSFVEKYKNAYKN